MKARLAPLQVMYDEESNFKEQVQRSQRKYLMVVSRTSPKFKVGKGPSAVSPTKCAIWSQPKTCNNNDNNCDDDYDDYDDENDDNTGAASEYQH